METDAERAALVLTNLLALARASRAELVETQALIDLSELARRVAAEFGQSALESGHEISLEADENCLLSGHSVILELALRNLTRERAGSYTAWHNRAHPSATLHPPCCLKWSMMAQFVSNPPARQRRLGTWV